MLYTSLAWFAILGLGACQDPSPTSTHTVFEHPTSTDTVIIGSATAPGEPLVVTVNSYTTTVYIPFSAFSASSLTAPTTLSPITLVITPITTPQRSTAITEPSSLESITPTLVIPTVSSNLASDSSSGASTTTTTSTTSPSTVSSSIVTAPSSSNPVQVSSTSSTSVSGAATTVTGATGAGAASTSPSTSTMPAGLSSTSGGQPINTIAPATASESFSKSTMQLCLLLGAISIALV